MKPGVTLEPSTDHLPHTPCESDFRVHGWEESRPNTTITVLKRKWLDLCQACIQAVLQAVV